MHFLDALGGWLMDVARWIFIMIASFVYPHEYSPWTGKVAEIVRPHEIRVLREDGKSEQIRIYGIHCPLGSHPFARDAYAYVVGRLLHRMVVVQPLPGKVEGPWYHPRIEARDAYGRIMALITVDGISLNKELLRNGIAWWYEPLVPFERGFKRLEDQSREAKRGLWHFPNPSPSWNFKATPPGNTNPFQKEVLQKTAPAAPEQPETTHVPSDPSNETPTNTEPAPMPSPLVPRESVDDKNAHEEVAPSAHHQAGESPNDDCPDRAYVMRVARAYRATANLIAGYAYICGQMALHWEDRLELARVYKLSPEGLLKAEQLMKDVANPCPHAVLLYEQVHELWSLCLQLASLASGSTNDRQEFEQRLSEINHRSEALLGGLNGRLSTVFPKRPLISQNSWHPL